MTNLDHPTFIVPSKSYLSGASDCDRLSEQEIVNAVRGVPLDAHEDDNTTQQHVLEEDSRIRKGYIEKIGDSIGAVVQRQIKMKNTMDSQYDDVVNGMGIKLKALEGSLDKVDAAKQMVKEQEARIEARERTVGRNLIDEKFHVRAIVTFLGLEIVVVALRAYFSTYEIGLGSALGLGLVLPATNLLLMIAASYVFYRTHWSSSAKLAASTAILTVFIAMNLYIAAIFTEFDDAVSIAGSVAYFLFICGLMALFFFSDCKRVFSVDHEDIKLMRKRVELDSIYQAEKANTEKQIARTGKNIVANLNKLREFYRVGRERFKSDAVSAERETGQVLSYLEQLTRTTEALINDCRSKVREGVKSQDPSIGIPSYYYQKYEMPAALQTTFETNDSIHKKIVEFDEKVTEFEDKARARKLDLSQEVKSFLERINASARR